MEPRIRCLGGHELFDAAGRSLRLPTRKSWALLAYLALADNRDIPREELATLLWPRSNDGQARASLRQELAVLRKTMAQAGLPAIMANKEWVSFAAPAALVDVNYLDHLIKTGDTGVLRRAVGLYRGEFLAGLNLSAHPFEDWLWVERQRLKTLAQAAYLQLLDLDMAGGDTDRAIATATALLSVEPTQEKGHRALMRLFRRTGRRADALQQFRLCSEILRRELDTGPSRETVALADEIRADLGAPASLAGGGCLESGAVDASVRSLQPVPLQPLRRTLTIACLGLAGVDASSQDCDPEDLAAAQDRFLIRAARVVTEHGGQIIAGPGDRVVACFGYPKAEATDSERAIRAALSLVSEQVPLAADLALWPRAAITSGAVAIRPASSGPGGAALTGAPFYTASRLAQLASGGEVVMAGDMQRQLAGRFDMQPVPPDRGGRRHSGDTAVILRVSRADAV